MLSPTTVLIVIGVVWLLITAAGLLPLVLLSFDPFTEMDQPGPVIAHASATLGPAWLHEQGFHPESAVRPLGMPIALFRHVHRHTAVAVYFAQDNVITDFVTAFPHHVGVTTSNTKDGTTAPNAPGSITQSMPVMSTAALWQTHLDAVVLLSKELGVDPIELQPVADEMKHHVKRQTTYILTRPWLILALPWRFFVTRHRKAGVSVVQQLERGWINLDKLRRQARGSEA